MTTEQRTNLKFLVLSGKSPTEALFMLQQVYKEHTLFHATIFMRHKDSKKDVRMLRMIPGVDQTFNQQK